MHALSRASVLAALGSLLLAFSSPAHAQDIWSDRSETGTVYLEILKPSFEEGDVGFVTGSMFLGVSRPVTDNVRLVGEVAFARGTAENPTGGEDESSSVFGNPYLGLEIGAPDASQFLEVGAAIPVSGASNDDLFGRFVGLASNLDREDAFSADVLSLSAVGNYRRVNETNVVVRLRAGPTLLYYTESSGESTDVLLQYGGLVGLDGDRFSVAASVTGRWIVTADGADFGEASIHQLGIKAGASSGRVRPQISLRVPLDDVLSDVLSYTLGVGLQIGLP